MNILHITGCNLGDDVFTTDAAIFGEAITWNNTRIRRDADAGKFGPPVERPVSIMPAMSELHDRNIDWNKVRGMINAYSLAPDKSKTIVEQPSVQLLVTIGDTLYRMPIDGNHRICARRILKMPTFRFFQIPEELERRYRVFGLDKLPGG